MRARSQAPVGPLPWRESESGPLLAGLIALLVFIAGLLLAASLAMNGLAGRWQSGVNGRWTVELPPGADGLVAVEVIDRAETILSTTAGVAGFRRISADESRRLLEPWLGSDADMSALPLPVLIEATIAPEAELTPEDLGRNLAQVKSDVRVTNHADWLSDLRLLAGQWRWLALGLLIVTGLAAVLAVMLAVRGGLERHSDLIRLLHTMGATDLFIARTFQRHALITGGIGGIAGSGAAALTVLLLQILSGSGADHGGLPTMVLLPWHWLLFVWLPLLAGLFAMLTARLTVLHRLGRLP